MPWCGPSSINCFSYQTNTFECTGTTLVLNFLYVWTNFLLTLTQILRSLECLQRKLKISLRCLISKIITRCTIPIAGFVLRCPRLTCNESIQTGLCREYFWSISGFVGQRAWLTKAKTWLFQSLSDRFSSVVRRKINSLSYLPVLILRGCDNVPLTKPIIMSLISQQFPSRYKTVASSQKQTRI